MTTHLTDRDAHTIQNDLVTVRQRLAHLVTTRYRGVFMGADRGLTEAERELVDQVDLAMRSLRQAEHACGWVFVTAEGADPASDG